MNNSPFVNSRLFISALSPFARRVRVVLREAQIPHTEQVVDLFGAQTPELKELFLLNPLGRVPVLKLSEPISETPHPIICLVESSHILERLFEFHPHPTLFPESKRTEISFWSGLALGVNEAIVRVYLESLRAPPLRDPEVQKEFEDTVWPTINLAEKSLSFSQTPSLQELDWAITMDYLSLRISNSWREKYPKLSQNLEGLSRLKSFVETSPPKA